MKIGGKKIEGANVEICVIPRGDDRIVFKCVAIIDLDDFEKLCPVPKIPMKILRGGKKVEDVESPRYKNDMEEYNGNRINYMILKSLEATEGLEWETVDMSDSDTWKNYESELKASGFSAIEVGRIIQTVMTANCLDEAKLQKARDSFLASQLTPDQSSSQMEEPDYMPSGELVKESA